MTKSIISLDQFVKLDKFEFINGKGILNYLNSFYKEFDNPNHFVEIGFLQSNIDFIILNNPKLYCLNIENKQAVSFDYCNDILSQDGIKQNFRFLSIDLFPHINSTLVHINLSKKIKFVCRKPYGFFAKPDSFMVPGDVFSHFKSRLPIGTAILERWIA